MVKADAYGHGVVEISKVLQEWGSTDFAVSKDSHSTLCRRTAHKQIRMENKA